MINSWVSTRSWEYINKVTYNWQHLTNILNLQDLFLFWFYFFWTIQFMQILFLFDTLHSIYLNSQYVVQYHFTKLKEWLMVVLYILLKLQNLNELVINLSCIDVRANLSLCALLIIFIFCQLRNNNLLLYQKSECKNGILDGTLKISLLD